MLALQNQQTFLMAVRNVVLNAKRKTQTFISTTFTFTRLLVSPAAISEVEKLVTYTFCTRLLFEYHTQNIIFEYRGMQIETHRLFCTIKFSTVFFKSSILEIRTGVSF